MSDLRSNAMAFLRLELLPGDLNAKLGHKWKYRHDEGRLDGAELPELAPPLSVSRDDLTRALSGVIDGRLRTDDLEEWANIILVWDAFDVVGDDRELVLNTLHEIANPLIEGALDARKVIALKARLK